MSWLLRWPEIFLAVLVAAFEAYRSGNTVVAPATSWTSQRKLDMRYVISLPHVITN